MTGGFRMQQEAGNSSPTTSRNIADLTSETSVDAAENIRGEQVARFGDEDFVQYFALSNRLAAVSVGYAQSYEFWLQTVLHAFARLKPSLTFLQVGGMDGKRYDPVYAFIKHYRWRGFILEPLADLFKALTLNYSGFGLNSGHFRCRSGGSSSVS